MLTAKQRASKLDGNKSWARNQSRQLYTYKDGETESRFDIKVRGDGTAIVDVSNLCRVVLHTGEIDEETKLERLIIVRELQKLKEAVAFVQLRNRIVYDRHKEWLEVQDYDEVYQRENGELINYVRPRKRGPKAKAMRAAKKHLRVANVG